MTKAVLLSCLLLVGCQSRPKVGVPSTFVFHETSLPQKAGTHLAAAYDEHKKELCLLSVGPDWVGWLSQSSDGGKSFADVEAFSQVAGRQPFRFSDDFKFFSGDSSRRLAYLDEEAHLLVANWDKSQWQQQSSSPWQGGFRQFSAGPQRWVLVGHSGGSSRSSSLAIGKTAMLASEDAGNTWQSFDWTPPVPAQADGTTIDPVGPGECPVVHVDDKNVLHLLVEDTHLRTTKETRSGCLYARSEAGQEFTSQFIDGNFSFRNALASQGKYLYLAMAEEMSIKGVSERTHIPYQLSLRVSSNSGKDWQPPLLLDDHKGIKQKLQMSVQDKHLAISWHDDRSPEAGIYLCASKDAGQSWTAPQKICERCESHQLVVTNQSILVVTSQPSGLWRADL